jgi:ubiquinone/menaquinone biosynthesis C-methylase UbiE
LNDSFATIAEAFSRTGERYDAFALDHPHLSRIRGKVYAQVERWLPSGSKILELNAGTGIDAVELARRGYIVHATDIAAGMLDRAREKASRSDQLSRISFQECSFTRLDQIQGGPYAAVFSNLGGLNCIPNLRPVIRQLPLVLEKNGLAIWVLMPRTCLWEMAEVLRGRPRQAFRRFAKSGTRAHLEGLYFQIYYFTPAQVVGWFGPDYKPLAVEGLSVLTPTLESKQFSQRFRTLYRTLAWLDDRVSSHRPWRGWGDFFVLCMRRAS